MNIDKLLHTLWGKSVGTPDYDKREWSELQQYIDKSNPDQQYFDLEAKKLISEFFAVVSSYRNSDGCWCSRFGSHSDQCMMISNIMDKTIEFSKKWNQ